MYFYILSVCAARYARTHKNRLQKYNYFFNLTNFFAFFCLITCFLPLFSIIYVILSLGRGGFEGTGLATLAHLEDPMPPAVTCSSEISYKSTNTE